MTLSNTPQMLAARRMVGRDLAIATISALSRAEIVAPLNGVAARRGRREFGTSRVVVLVRRRGDIKRIKVRLNAFSME